MDQVSAGDVADMVSRVAHRLRREAQQALAPLGLTPAQERALRIITRSGGSIRMGELATWMGIVPRSATGLVDRLEEAGLVARTADPDSRRSVLVGLSEGGRAVLAGMATARNRAAGELLAPLSEGQRAELAGLLRLLVPDQTDRPKDSHP